MKYDEPEPGQWIMPVLEGYKIACCDCGLVHRYDFRVNEEGRPEYRVFTAPRSTAAVRRETMKREARA